MGGDATRCAHTTALMALLGLVQPLAVMTVPENLEFSVCHVRWRVPASPCAQSPLVLWHHRVLLCQLWGLRRSLQSSLAGRGWVGSTRVWGLWGAALEAGRGLPRGAPECSLQWRVLA